MARILLAEDDESMRGFLATALRRAGYDVDDVPDGVAALASIEEDDYDLLVADIIMPGMDGVELARQAGLVAPQLKVMFITGFAAIAMNQQHYGLQHAQILSKPFHLKDLVIQVERLLEA